MNLRRCLAALVAALVALAVGATPAAAHGGAVEATDYRARLLRAPRIAGLTVSVIEAGGRLAVTSTDVQVVVLGFEGEPYLSIGPEGVSENRRSPAVYLNAERSGGEEPPEEADPDAPPRWVKVHDGSTWRWHDHRMHWMAADPPAVREAPGERHVVNRWEVPMVAGERALAASGDIVYVPGPATWPWAVLAALLVAAVVLAARRWGARAALLAALPVVALADAGRVAGLVLAVAGGTDERVRQALDVGVLSAVGWVLVVAAAVRLGQRQGDGPMAAGLASLLLGLVGGVLEWGDLGRSQLAVGGPDDLGRACVAVAAGAGLGIAATALLAAYRPLARLTRAGR